MWKKMALLFLAPVVTWSISANTYAPVADTTVRPASKAQVESVNSQIKEYLNAVPGAYQVGPYSVASNGGDVIMNFPPPGEDRVSTDPALRPDLRQAERELSTARAQNQSGEVVAAPVQTADTSWHGCPEGTFTKWYCFYDNENFGGRMLQYKDCSNVGSGLKQDFRNDYFNDQTSSWVVTGKQNVQVYDDAAGARTLWFAYGRSSSTFVGWDKNDRATAFVTRCG